MIPRRRSKRGPADSVMSLPDGHAIIQQGFPAYATKAVMSDSEADQGFRVRDRRGRADEPASSPRPVKRPEPMTPPEPVSPPQPDSPPESTAGGARSLIRMYIEQR